MYDLWLLAESNWSPQCKVVINAALIHILYAIWTTGNKARFNNEIPNRRSAVAWIFANITMTGNFTSKLSSLALRDFITLKKFNVNLHPPKMSTLKEVIWKPPLIHWVKCNTDGASNGSTSACDGLFRNSDAEFICAFAENTGTSSASQLSCVVL
jgi:hypothetical protein